MSVDGVYLGLGSNLAEPIVQLQLAIKAIQKLSDTKLIACSSAYHSLPMGPSDQPDYINAVVALDTKLPPEDLLQALQQIELEHGRQRNGQRWGPRTLDIDILLFGSIKIQSEHLTIPHYGMKNREFVLYPLAEISPNLMLPCGSLLKTVLETCPRRGLKRLDDVELANVIGTY